MISWLKKNRGFLVVTLVYLLTFLYMLPLRDQTFQDDWAYNKSVYNFLQTGVLKVNEWSATSLIFQIFWGSLFAKLFGFSPKIMHLSVIVLFYFGVMAFYLLLKRLKINELKSTIFSIVLLSNPWIFQFLYSFLTDIPYISLLIISLYFYIRGLQDKNNLSFFLGSLFAGMAMLIRQLGATIPMAMFIILVYQSLATKKFDIKKYLAAFSPFLITYFLYSNWLAIPGNMTISQHHSTFPAIKKEILPYLLPINRIGLSSATHTLYAEFIKKIFSYFFHLVTFLAPIFLIFKINIKGTLRFFKKYRIGIFITTLVFGLFFSIEYFIHFGRPRFELPPPILLLKYNKFLPFTQETIWKTLGIFSVIIWLPLIASEAQKFLSQYITKKKPKKQLCIILSFTGVLVFLLYYLQIFPLKLKPVVPAQSGIFTYLSIYLQEVSKSKLLSLEILRDSWLAFAIPTIAFLTLIYGLFNCKLKASIKSFNLESNFLLIAFLIQISVIVFIMYFFWSQYMIACIPYAIIFIAYATKQWKINIFKTVLFLSLMLIFSVSSTKNRYSDLGFRWTMGSKLVQMGVEPANIDVYDESWMRWSYAEATMQEAIKEKGGNKYLVFPTNTWLKVERKTEQPTVSFTQVPLNFKNSDMPEATIFIDSGVQSFSLFSKTRYVGFSPNTK